MSQNLVMFVCGMKGSGKSTLVREIAGERARVFYIDSVGEAQADPSFEIVYGFRKCVVRMLQASQQERFRIALQCDDTEDLQKLLSMAYETPDHLLIVEETSFYCSPSNLPAELSKLVRYGRHRRIDQIYVARRPSEIHRDLTANADIGVTFSQHEPRDLIYLRAVGGAQAERVRSLPPFRVFAWGPGLERAPLAVLKRLDTAAVSPVASPVTEKEHSAAPEQVQREQV